MKRGVQLLGTIASDLGDTDRGRELLGESIELARSYGDRFGETVSLHSLGDLELTAVRLDAAATAYRAALGEAREIDSGRLACYCVAGLSAVAAAGGEEERAARLWRYAEQLEAELGVKIVLSTSALRRVPRPDPTRARACTWRLRPRRGDGVRARRLSRSVRVEQVTCANPRGHVLRLGATNLTNTPTGRNEAAAGSPRNTCPCLHKKTGPGISAVSSRSDPEGA